MRKVQINQKLVLYYLKKVAPKKGENIVLNQFDKVVDKAVMSASKGDYDTYFKCVDAINKANIKFLGAKSPVISR